MSYRKMFIIMMFVVTIYIIYAISLFSCCKGYYTYQDMFGPLSKDITVMISLLLFLLVSYSLMYYLVTNLDVKKWLPFGVVLLALTISSIRLLPDVADMYYTQNFYDAGDHMVRGAFVTLTGHSDPSIDGYFDLQPGFFWFTAILIHIVYGNPVAYTDPVFGFFVKWFHVVAIMIYIPILFALNKNFNQDLSKTFVMLFLFFLFNTTKAHYAAQTYANALFWLAIMLVFATITGEDKKRLVMLFIILAAIVFVHQGVTMFTLVTLLSATFVTSFLIRAQRVSRILALLVLYLTSIWLVYLLYISNFTLMNFLHTLISVIKKYLFEGVIEVTSSAMRRVWEPWENVVVFKALYMAIFIFGGLILTALQYRLTKNQAYLLRTTIIFTVSAAMGSIAIALGGAGYIERIPEMLLPLLLLPFVEIQLESPKNRRSNTIWKSLVTIVVFSLLLMSPFVYFSGRNFQSITLSETHSTQFLREHTDTIAGIYLTITAHSLYDLLLTNYTHIPHGLYRLMLHHLCLFLYYSIGDLQLLYHYADSALEACNVIYFNPTAQLLYC
jgi:hypothetical protein